MTRLLRPGTLLGTAALLVALACGDSNVLGPDNQLEVTNATDNFQIQASSMVDITQTLTYTWQNTGTQANVNQSGNITAGSATLTISDADGTEVYSRTLTQTGTFQTDPGTAGVWTIVIELSGADGTLNARVQKP